MSTIEEAWEAVSDWVRDAPKDATVEYRTMGSDLTREEAFRYAIRLITVGQAATIENPDVLYPELVPYSGSWMAWGFPCPDSQYFYAPLNGDHTYRLFGHRGTPHMLRAVVWSGTIHDFGANALASSMESYRLPDGSFVGDLDVGADGTVEVVLSHEPHEGNWLELPPGPAILFMRHEFYDWETEELAPISIERVGAQYPPNPEELGQVEQAVGNFANLLQDYLHRFGMAATSFYPPDPSHFEFGHEVTGTGFKADQSQPQQIYARGSFICQPDEAVILEMDIPDCKYWSFALYSPYLEIYDNIRRQSSLNGSQAFVGADGAFRAVISQRDPGVANWLDCGGHEEGIIMGRCVGSTTLPTVRLEVVPFEEVRDHLPPEMPSVTASERSQIVRNRRLAYYRCRGSGAGPLPL